MSSPTDLLMQQSQNKGWVLSESTQNALINNGLLHRQTKLLFNEDKPSSFGNRATRVGLPSPIVIERLLPASEAPENVESTRSSITFKAVSEDRLQAAVKLAKQDLRRRRLQLQSTKSQTLEGHSPEASLFERPEVEHLQERLMTPTQTKSKVPKSKSTVFRVDNKQSSTQKNPDASLPRAGMSPPTRDPGPRMMEGGKEASLSCEIRKLQSELELYIQKVEEFVLRVGKNEEPLDPEEQTKLEIRQQKQAARSARIIYVLQRQVKDIQGDLEKLQTQTLLVSKKATAISKLSAAYRASRRALLQLIHQISDPSQHKVPPHYREMSQLIRQLSLCSAKVEVDHGSAVPLMTINILEKLEILDSALSKQEMLEKLQAQACPSTRKLSPNGTSSPSAPRGPSTAHAQGAGKPAKPTRVPRGQRMAMHKPRIAFRLPMSRSQVLRDGVINLAQQRELKDLQTNRKNRGALGTEKLLPGKVKRNQTRDSGFQQPTVSSRLRVNQLPQKEHAVPWIPTSPHSPPLHRSPERGRAEARCLFSPVKASPSPPKPRVVSGLGTRPGLSLGKKQEADNEALRKAWLDNMTMQRLKDLNQLSQEEAEGIQRLRFEAVSPSQLVETAEQNARIRPLLAEAQNLGEQKNERPCVLTQEERDEQLSEVLLDDLLEDASRAVWAVETDRQLEGMAQRRLQAPTLESMLLRMEEIQRDQEEVRRRFACISYSDSLHWDKPGVAGSQFGAPDTQPTSPQPVRLTKPVLTQSSVADIFLQKPVETGHSLLSESSLAEEAAPEEQQHTNNAPSDSVQGNTVIAVSNSMLRNIRRYREDYNSYLRALADKDVCSLNPQTVAESLSDELLSEVLADVAAEFQDVVEECAEAVFTSEFLRPIQSPPRSADVSSCELMPLRK